MEITIKAMSLNWFDVVSYFLLMGLGAWKLAELTKIACNKTIAWIEKK